jgi:hypothetical protein
MNFRKGSINRHAFGPDLQPLLPSLEWPLRFNLPLVMSTCLQLLKMRLLRAFMPAKRTPKGEDTGLDRLVLGVFFPMHPLDTPPPPPPPPPPLFRPPNSARFPAVRQHAASGTDLEVCRSFCDSGEKYSGEWHKGKMHGRSNALLFCFACAAWLTSAIRGVFTQPGGPTYDGDFYEDSCHGNPSCIHQHRFTIMI